MKSPPTLVILRDHTGPRVVERGETIPFELEEEALRISVSFGSRPKGVTCPAALLSLPIRKHPGRWLVVVSDHGVGFSDAPIRFTFQFLPVTDSVLIDPFESGLGHSRLVEPLYELLKTGDGPLLLGATQAILDGCKIAMVQLAPNAGLIRGIWMLLPNAHRRMLSFATFAFSGELNFDFAVYPAMPSGRFLSEEQCRDYPEGRYELALQSAIESKDQTEVDRLFARRTSGEVMRMAAGVLLFALVVAAVARFL